MKRTCFRLAIYLVLLLTLPLLSLLPTADADTSSVHALPTLDPDGWSNRLSTFFSPDKTGQALPPNEPVPSGEEPPNELPTAEAEEVPAEQTLTLPLPAQYPMLDHKTGLRTYLTPLSYVTGVVAAEMPVTFEPEAIKAQAIAAHSYALYQIGQAIERGEEPMLSTDPEHFQSFLSEEECQSRYGEAFAEEYRQLKEAVAEVIDIIMVYESKPAAAAFHSISGGRTEAAETVWGNTVPYLQAVDSSIDLQNSRCHNTVNVTKEELLTTLSQVLASADGETPRTGTIVVTSRSESGTVLFAEIDGVRVSGQNIRTWFSLPSANFTVEEQEGEILFHCQGVGHGVGMSQYGANAMARVGENYRTILSHYYPGVSLVRLEK